MPEPRIIRTTCCIAGGGPAGMMLGLLLGRAGIDVLVLEKHADFLRDFRGDTVHPSTMEVIHELGLLESFLDLPHQKLSRVEMHFGESPVTLAEFSRLPVQCPYIAFMPQWDFLDFLARHAAAYPGFALAMESEVLQPVVAGGRITGLRARDGAGEFEVRAQLTVAADGRDSTLREQSQLTARDLGAPMDVLWFKLDKPPGAGPEPLGRFGAGQILVAIDRGGYWQCGYVIAKGVMANLESAGFDVFRRRIAEFAPNFAEPLRGLDGWEDVKPLTVQVNRLAKWWRPGFLCIGDAAHAMSPVAGVGINLAIQDAVAAANVLARPLGSGELDDSHLEMIQRRRNWPTALTQRLQLAVQNRIIAEALHERRQFRPPAAIRLISSLAPLRRLAGRVIGLGMRPERVHSPEPPGPERPGP